MNQFNAKCIIEFRQVGYCVAGGQVLSDLSFTLKRGERLVLLGRSGCGKTTCLRLINRMIEATAGQVFVEGENIMARDAVSLRRRIGYVIQDGGLFPHRTVAENIATVPRLEKWSEDKIRFRTTEMLQLVGLEPKVFANRFPAQLSGGQRQRVGVARALAADAPVVLLDEPFGALDPLTRDKLQGEFRELCERLEKTIVFVTHDLREALRTGTHIGLMDGGRIVVYETPDEFIRSGNELAREYLRTIE